MPKKIKLYLCGGIVVEIEDLRLLFDPWSTCDKKFDIIFVSHGHTDHVEGLPNYLTNGVNTVYLSKETFDVLLAQSIMGSTELSAIKDKILFVGAGDEIELKNNVRISFHNSGHVIGGLMIRIETKDISIGYTGDFNFENTAVSDKADLLESDILIMDSTYGSPKYIFPQRSFLYERIRETLNELIDEGKIPILHGYALGKGQELTKISNLFTKEKISVDKRVGSFNRIYEKSLGKKLGEYSIGGKGRIFIRGIRGYRRKSGQHVHIFFTGWALKRKFKAAMGFPLSSHADFMGLLNYVIENRPKRVFTLFSYAETFAKFLRSDMDLEARPLPTRTVELDARKSKIVKRRKRPSLDDFLI